MSGGGHKWGFMNWKVLLLFLGIIIVYSVCTQPDWSWVGYDCDLGDFLTSAEYGTLSHFPGNPLYSVLSWLVFRLPLFTEGWRLAFFLSTVPSIVTSILVFFIVKKKTDNVWSPYIGCLAVAGANVFLVQSIIIEVYALSAFIATLSFFFITYSRYRLAAVFTGFCFAVHPFAIFPALAFLISYKELRKQWKFYLPCIIIPYIYIVILAITKESLSTHSSSGPGLFMYVLGSLRENANYWGSLSISHIPDKLWIASVAFVGMFGAALIPMVKAINRNNAVIIGAASVPILYYIGNAVELTILHLVIAIPFLGILAGLGVEKLRFHPSLVLIFSVGLLVIMPLFYDIGNVLDEELSARSFYSQLDSVPDNSIIVMIDDYKGEKFSSGRENTLILLYNEKGGNLIPVYSLYVSDVDIPGYGNAGDEYRDSLIEDYNIETPCHIDEDLSKSENLWENVALLKESNPSNKLFYLTIPEDRPFMRVLTEYNG